VRLEPRTWHGSGDGGSEVVDPENDDDQYDDDDETEPPPVGKVQTPLASSWWGFVVQQAVKQAVRQIESLQ